MLQFATELLAARPRRVASCAMERQCGAADAPPAYVLKDTEGRRYMRLSEEGLFLFEHIDGSRTIRDLCRAYAERYGRPPDDVMRAIARLLESEFIALAGFAGHEREAARGSKIRRQILGLCTCYWWMSDTDRAVTALHAWIRPLYAPLAQLFLLLLATAGFMVFVFGGHTAHIWTNTRAPVWIVSFALQVLVHEAAHAATAKHFGRAVHRVGIGWYYFAPVAFVDTSDCWAARRRERILVSAAGPYSNLLLGGLAALPAILLPAGALADELWSLCAIGYMLAIVNMNPLLELDGYYVAMDWLELPDLRSRALGSLVAALGVRSATTAHRHPRPILVGFGAASLAYGLMIVAAILLAGHARIENLAATSLPHGIAQALGWVAACGLSLLTLNRVLGDVVKAVRVGGQAAAGCTN